MSYTHLTEEERFVIGHLHIEGVGQREIGRRLRRHHSTIGRELQRAKPERPRVAYWFSWAHPLALKKRHQARHYIKADNERLVRYVDEKLWQQWSPMEISHRLRIDFPADARMRISHETIYRWVYEDASLGGGFYRNLRRRHKKRRRQKRYGTGRRFADCKRISQRPAIVATRQRFGDWEGDTIAGQRSSGLIATVVERKSRYLLAAKLEDKKAETLTVKGVNSGDTLSNTQGRYFRR